MYPVFQIPIANRRHSLPPAIPCYAIVATKVGLVQYNPSSREMRDRVKPCLMVSDRFPQVR